MRIKQLAAALALAATVLLGAAPSQPVDAPLGPNERVGDGNTVSVLNGTSPSSLEQQMVNLVNQERAKAGLPALTVNPTLTLTARTKSQDMATNNYFSHQSPTLGSPFDQMKRAGVDYWTAGENIAQAPSVERAHTLLMQSPGHKANILSNRFNQVGIGIVKSAHGYTFTQQFIGAQTAGGGGGTGGTQAPQKPQDGRAPSKQQPTKRDFQWPNFEWNRVPTKQQCP